MIMYSNCIAIFFSILIQSDNALIPLLMKKKANSVMHLSSPSTDRPQNPQNPKESETLKLRKLLSIAFTALSSPRLANALDRPMDDPLYRKAIYNIPSDDFWYPPYFIGKWNTTLTFDNAVFTEKFGLDVLSKDDNLPGTNGKKLKIINDTNKILKNLLLNPGFSKYSVIFAPDMGKDVTFVRRFAQIDSHPREDHAFNIRQIVSAFLPDVIYRSISNQLQSLISNSSQTPHFRLLLKMQLIPSRKLRIGFILQLTDGPLAIEIVLVQSY